MVPPARRHAADRLDARAHQEAAHRLRLGPAQRRLAEEHRLHRVRHHRRGRRPRLGVDRRPAPGGARRADAARRRRRRSARRPACAGHEPRRRARQRRLHHLAERRAGARAMAAARFRHGRASTAAWSSTGARDDYAVAYDVEVSDDGADLDAPRTAARAATAVATTSSCPTASRATSASPCTRAAAARATRSRRCASSRSSSRPRPTSSSRGSPGTRRRARIRATSPRQQTYWTVVGVERRREGGAARRGRHARGRHAAASRSNRSCSPTARW